MSIQVKNLIEKFQLEIVTGDKESERAITVSDLNRPGIELAGFFRCFSPERVQILGNTELDFLTTLPIKLQEQHCYQLCSYPIPCLIITRGREINPFLLQGAASQGIPVLRTTYSTTKFISILTNYLEEEFAPTILMHGVLVEVYGVGVLITGESGIGKSETALELVKRGHRLVADDAVEIKKLGREYLLGQALAISRHLIEIRGLGILDISTLFGAGAVRITKRISLVILLEEWKEGKFYDRLGLDEEYQSIMNVSLPQITVPVKPGRSLATIIEVAAMNYRLKMMGHHAAWEFAERLKEHNLQQDG